MEDCYKIGIKPEDLNIDTMIYRNLLKKDMKEIFKKYDGIIFDEYHRTGAKQTYKKIKQLKRLLVTEKSDKKFIGLTATPIRYLDKARNMTDEIFDGHVASKLSLAEAMLENLLPVPYYINSKIACTDQYGSMLKKINRLSQCELKKELIGETKGIPEKISSDAKNVREMLNKYLDRKDGKYIIFCDTIEQLKECSKSLNEWFKDIGEVEQYEVHSYQKRKENKEQLAAFNNTKSKLSVLLCVDILNEGVHVDDIDGVMFLRKTTSPIIFFQQLGRALSFSGRNKQIKVFDLVNNFGNHNAIDAVFLEFQEEMQRKIKEHPEKADKYKELLSRFKIMDETRDILRKINSISEKVTPEKIIMSHVEYATNTFYNACKANKHVDVFRDKVYRKAYAYLSKYSKYVTNEQFEKLVETKMVLPYGLFMSEEERKASLAGFDSFYEKQLAQSEIYFRKLIAFVSKNRKIPANNAESLEEQELCKSYYAILPTLRVKQKEMFLQTVKAAGVKLTCIEKPLLDVKMNEEEIGRLVEMGNFYTENKLILPDYMRMAIEKTYISYSSDFEMQLNNILEKDEELIQERKVAEEKTRYESMSKILSFIEENTGLTNEELTKQIKEADAILTGRDMAAIKRKVTEIKKKKIKAAMNEDGLLDLEDFCKGISKFSGDGISKKKKDVMKSEVDCSIVLQVLDFMKTHNGKLPNPDSEDLQEHNLGILMKELAKSTYMYAEFKDAESNNESVFYNPLEILTELTNQKVAYNRLQKVIIEYAEFFIKNGRKPLTNSKDEFERNLAIQFEKSIKHIPPAYVEPIRRNLNARKSMKKTTAAYISNMLKSKNDDERGK